jgi:flagellin-like hook-associated protein FlgL
MAIVLSGTNLTSATEKNLSAANSSVEKSLGKLSSGQRITAPADDAGGAAVSLKLEAMLKRLSAVETNLLNADSFVRVQDDALKSVGDLVTRMSELKVLSQDVSKSPADIANYATEYWELAAEIRKIGQRTFNGIPLFSTTDQEEFLHCQSRQDGGPTIEIVLPPLKEPSLLDVFGEHIYEIVLNAIQWNAAQSEAESKGGHLATITSSEEWKEILWQLGNKVTADPLWIGLRQTGGPEPDGGWHWITNEIFAYTKWKDGEPDNDGFSGVGAAADRLAWNLVPGCGRWYDETKTNKLTVANAWDGGYLLEYWSDSSKTTKVYEMVKKDMTWDEAKDAAYAGKRDSGKTDIPPDQEPHLANLSTEQELNEARNQLKAAGNFPSSNKLWLGGYQPDNVTEPPPTNGWQWIADVDGGVTPPWTVPIGQDTSGWYMGKAGGVDIWGPWCVNQPDNVGDESPNAWSGYISGPFGEWSDGIYDHQVKKGIVGYLLEKDNDLTRIPLSGITRTLEWVAHYRARCGAESMAIGIAATAARTAHVNLEQARSRIADVDIAQATVALTRAKILSETGAQMLVKAHDAMQISLKLLQSVPAQ